MQQNLSKTNPVHTTKAKAFDLANAIPNALVSDLLFYGLVFLSTTKIADFVGFTGHVTAQKWVSDDTSNWRIQLNFHTRNSVSPRPESTKCSVAFQFSQIAQDKLRLATFSTRSSWTVAPKLRHQSKSKLYPDRSDGLVLWPRPKTQNSSANTNNLKSLRFHSTRADFEQISRNSCKCFLEKVSSYQAWLAIAKCRFRLHHTRDNKVKRAKTIEFQC